MIVEVHTFRLAADAEEAAFLEADRRVQELLPTHAGFLRRTTARGADGEWLVLVLWSSDADADRSMKLAETHPAMSEFMAVVDQATLQTKRFATLD